MAMVLVNGRVEERTLEQARRVLSMAGLTVSEIIRSTLDTIARTGAIPYSAKPERVESAAERVRNATRFFESQEMPGRIEGITDEEVLEAERLARFGY